MATTDSHQTALPQFQVHEEFDEVRYVLPPRPLGKLRLIGLVPLFIGLFSWGFAAFWILHLVQQPARNVGAFELLMMLPALAVFVEGVIAIVVAWFIFAGYSELRLAGGDLWSVERLGPFRWSRRRAVASIRQLTVARLPAKVNNQPVTSGPLAELGALRADCEGTKPFWIVLGYPHEWLASLAGDLAKRFQLAALALLAGGRVPAVSVVEERLGEPEEEEEVAERPADSKVGIEQHSNGVTLTVPAAGVWGGSKGMFVFGLIWSGIALPISIAFMVAPNPGPWIVRLIGVPFVLVGAGLLTAAVNMGNRRAVLAVVGDNLMILQTGLFGSKRGEWKRAELTAVRAGPSGMAVNDRPVLELQVQPKGGRKFGLLAGRDEDELRWMASTLRRSLGLSKSR